MATGSASGGGWSHGDVRYWLRILIVNAVGALTACGVLGRFAINTPWTHRWRCLGFSYIYANAIGGVAALVIPQVLARFGGFGRKTRVVLLLVVIPIAIVIGCALAGGILVLSRLIEPREFVAEIRGSLRISFAVATVLILAVIAYESLRGQLRAATLELQTRQLEEARARRLALEAQLASLEARVNPHFLFNTLNSIAELVHEDPAAAERVVAKLAALMRSSLEGGAAPLVPLEQELQLVRAYLDIERVRLDTRLRYRIDAEPGSLLTRVPRLSLQTLVENAVKYAVSSRRDGGTIEIRTSARDGTLHLQVEDDGPGFETTELLEGHGLALLQARLAMMFPGRAGLRIDSRPGRTSVTVDVPMTGEAP